MAVLFLVFFLNANTVSAATSRTLPTAYHESTYCASGCDYSSLQAWEDATDNDLVTAQMGEVLTCYEGIYNDSVTVAGATTNASYFRVIRAASGARGTPTSGVRFEKLNQADSIIVLNASENYNQIHDIAVRATSTSTAAGAYAIGFYTAVTVAPKFIGCLVYDTAATGSTTASGRGFQADIYSNNSRRVP